MDDSTQILKELKQLISKIPNSDPEYETQLIIEHISANGIINRDQALEIIQQRKSGIPLSIILKQAKFMDLDLFFENGVFVIRPETELLGWSAVKKLKEIINNHYNNELLLIDVGCGSGNLTCGISKAVPEVTIYAIDILDKCIELTRKNIELHGIDSRVHLKKGDLFQPLANKGLEGKIDVIIMNPPYIASNRLKDDRSFLIEHEPIEAFDGGPFGITIVQRLIKESLVFLKSGGYLLFEFGVGQDKQIQKLFERAGGYRMVEFEINKAGEARVAVGEK